MISFYQCWPGRKDVDLKSIEVRRRSFHCCVIIRCSLMNISRIPKTSMFTLCLLVSGFQVLVLVPRVLVHAGLRRPPKVHSEQHQLETGSRRRMERRPVVTEELVPQLSGKSFRSDFTPFFFSFFFKDLYIFHLPTSSK